MKNNYLTPQEEFWASEFGKSFIDRNNGQELLASNLAFMNDDITWFLMEKK